VGGDTCTTASVTCTAGGLTYNAYFNATGANCGADGAQSARCEPGHTCVSVAMALCSR
jgi:hypothetical protein